MKIDDRDSAECQNWEKKDINVFFFWNCFKLEKDKRGIMSSSSKKEKREKNVRGGESCTGSLDLIFRERECLPSL